MEAFFKDLKVVELANVLAGPAVGRFFSELGAEVIKIENKLTNGDVTRSWKLATEDKGSAISAYYASVNWNKKSVLIDLTSKDEKQKVYELISKADVVISNYKPGDDVKLGMDYDTIKGINPSIIYAHITGFGENNPRTAYDIVLQAETGYMYMNSQAKGKPLKMPVALIDVLAAHQLKEGILMALMKKLKTGKGSKISVSLFDTAVCSLANQASNWLMTKQDPQPIGSLHPNIAPYGELLLTADGKQLVLAIGNNKQFEKLCTILNAAELLNNSKFIDNTHRLQHRTELHELLQIHASKCNSVQLMKEFIQNDVPVGLIKSLKEVFENNAASYLILEEMYNTGEKSRSVRTIAFALSE
jgi:crotonobetainyl-CoA:carnitine CoA-transferase CaiB-like acyl-CoA transferase